MLLHYAQRGASAPHLWGTQTRLQLIGEPLAGTKDAKPLPACGGGNSCFGGAAEEKSCHFMFVLIAVYGHQGDFGVERRDVHRACGNATRTLHGRA